MSNDDIAAAVLECVGGFSNVAANSLCATRLRITLKDPSFVERNALHSIKGVLGIADRGPNGIEVVFGPNLVRSVYRAFDRLTGLNVAGTTHPAESISTRPTSKIQVKITPETPGLPHLDTEPEAIASDTTTPVPPVKDEDTSALLEMLDEVDL